MKKLLFVLALLCVAAGTLQAQNVYQWFGTNTDTPRPAPATDWNTGYAWMTELGPNPTGSYGVVPDAQAKVKINNVQWGTNWEQYSPVVNGTVTIGDVFICEGGAGLSPEYLTVATGSVLNVSGAGGTAAGQINIGYQLGANGTLFVNGTANVSGPVHVGWGGNGTLVVTGTLNALDLDIAGDPIATGTGTIQVNGGKIVVAGFIADRAQGWVDDGILTANGSADNVVIAYDEVLDATIITPEPVSIALLGLGALLLRKRS